MKSGLAIAALALTVGAGAILWHGRAEWRSAEAQRQKLYAAVRPVAAPPLAPAVPPEIPQAVKYADIANKNLFSKDRNPNVIIPPPKAVEEKKMPPLPVVYGVLGLPSGTRAIMAVKAGESSRAVRAGDEVGEFKIAALDTRQITFEWDGKEISKPVDELIDRSGAAPAASNAVPAPPPAQIAAPPATGLAPVNSNAQPTSTAPSNPKLGLELGIPGASVRGCVQGDSSPAGTVADGYRKQIVPGPFGAGTQCSWIPAK